MPIAAASMLKGIMPSRPGPKLPSGSDMPKELARSCSLCSWWGVLLWCLQVRSRSSASMHRVERWCTGYRLPVSQAGLQQLPLQGQAGRLLLG